MESSLKQLSHPVTKLLITSRPCIARNPSVSLSSTLAKKWESRALYKNINP